MRYGPDLGRLAVTARVLVLLDLSARAAVRGDLVATSRYLGRAFAADGERTAETLARIEHGKLPHPVRDQEGWRLYVVGAATAWMEAETR